MPSNSYFSTKRVGFQSHIDQSFQNMEFKKLKPETAPFLSNDANEYLKSLCRVFPSGWCTSEVEIKPFEFILPKKMSDNLEIVQDFEVRADDVYVCGMMKCGSSWTQNIVWLLTHGLDYETNRTVNRKNIMCSFENITTLLDAGPNGVTKVGPNGPLKDFWKEHYGNMETIRVFKTHYPAQHLPKQIWTKTAKIIYIFRNPKDMIASEYHFLRNAFRFNFTMDDIVNGITNDSWLFTSRINHILGFWHLKHLSNIFFVAYEDLIADPFASFKTIAEFLGCNYNDDQLKELVSYSSFDNMRKVNTQNREDDINFLGKIFKEKRPDSEFKFLRKGKVGSYRDDLNDEQIKKIDAWIERSLKNTDFKFKVQ